MGPKILTVDDSKTIRLIVARAFKSFACEIFEAADGVEGLTAAQRERPDIIILDLTMPIMDGVEMLTKLKADPELRSIPVVMLTAESGRENVLRIAKLGVRDYLIKPFKEESIVERVGRIIALKAKSERITRAKRFDDPLQVLVVDDKPAIIEQIQAALSSTPWKVQGVAQPGQAVDSCSQVLPDIALVSLSLPEGAGFILFQMLRANVRTKGIPIVALSVKTANDEQAPAQQLGFNGVVTKPIDFCDVQLMITRALNLDTSHKYFAFRDGVLVLMLPAIFSQAVANDITTHLRHKVGSSEKYLPGVMKTEEPENQVTLVAQTICLAKKCLDLIVDAFHAAVVDPVLPPCKNAALMAEESSGHLPHLADARFVGPSAPLVEERPHLAIGGLLPKQAQGFLEQIASEQGLIVLERLIEARQFLLLHVLAAHQEQIPDPLHGLLHRAAGFVDHLSAQAIQFLVHQLDDVETVEHDCRLGQVLHHGRPVTGTHVHGHGLNLRRAQAQGPPERAQRIPAAPLSNPDDLAGVEVNDQGVELFVAAKVNLVNGQAANVLQAGVAIALLQPGLNDFLDRIPSQARHHRQIRHCHHPPPALDKGLGPVGVPDVWWGKRGETSKLWPHARHSHWGTSVTTHTRFKPMGTVCNSRTRLPLRFPWALWHRGHISNSCRAASTNRIHPAPYTVRTQS